MACMLAALIAAGGASFWLHRELTIPCRPGDPEVFVDIPPGARAHAIAVSLAGAGVVRSAPAVELYLRWIGAERRLKAGEYRFWEPASAVDVIGRIVRGDVYFLEITIPEGHTADETVALILAGGIGERSDLKKALRCVEWIRDIDPAARTLEGYLFPDTYRFARRADSDQIVRTFVQRFRERYRSLVSRHAAPPDWPARRIVTLASLIEKEAKLAEERPLIASVLVNRLARGIPLGCDPTIIYALKLTGAYDGNLRKRDLSLDSPYNTYLYRGLPPGPIASPGEDSLRAALTPARTDYLYYVSRNDGSHQFSKDWQSHDRAVDRFQRSQARRPALSR